MFILGVTNTVENKGGRLQQKTENFQRERCWTYQEKGGKGLFGDNKF